MIQARVSKFIENCQITSPGKFLSRSRIIIPFSGNYHVPDSIDWCSSSGPSLADTRPAKRRRREERYIRDPAGGLQRAQGGFPPDLILVANARKKSILLLHVFA
jgi:hypothetical protein